MCDDVPHCKDGNDETQCGWLRKSRGTSLITPPPTLVNFDGRGATVVTALVKVNGSVCPDTHFQCADNGYCLPVFVLCNQVYDCPHHEDELQCNRYTCPGFYRCRGSTVCLHHSHLCDGVFHCPQRDDEVLCNMVCPSNCTCYGWAFRCKNPFHAVSYPELRYLDASNSTISLSDVVNNTLLVYASFAHCNLKHMVFLPLPNLHSLDLGSNRLTSVTGHDISHMPKLQYLTLANNPLTSVFPHTNKSNSLDKLYTLDLAGVHMAEIDLSRLSIFPSLRVLNLTSCKTNRILGEGFRFLQQLRVLDSRGCPLTFFPEGVFNGVDNLETVLAENYKVCCPSVLPEQFILNRCKAPSDELSSCKALLRSNVYRGFLSVFTVLALIGNLISFVFRVTIFRINRKIGFEVLVSSLSIADFLMGIYLAIIGVADRVYLGTYLWNDISWKSSSLCTTAGVLSLVSSEVSAFIIFLITLDRFLALQFPFSQLHFHRKSALIVCLVVWTAGVVIAAIPVLPNTSHWNFFGQNAICNPLPITRKNFAGRSYAFAVMIVLNFALFVLIALGQVFIYWSVQKNSMKGSSSSNKDLALARRLIAIAVSDFLCWFPVGLVGMLASSGFHISGEVNVAMAVFVLPLNAAVNPFLYTISTLLERLHLRREQLLVQSLMQQKEAVTNHQKLLSDCESDKAQQVFRKWLASGVLSADSVTNVVRAVD